MTIEALLEGVLLLKNLVLFSFIFFYILQQIVPAVIAMPFL